MKKKIMMSFIAISILLSACNNSGTKGNISKNSEITAASTRIVTENSIKSSVQEKEADKNLAENNVITELKRGRFEYTRTLKDIVPPVKDSYFVGYSNKGAYFVTTKNHDKRLDGGLADSTYYISNEKGSREIYKLHNHYFGLFDEIYEGDLIVGVEGGLTKEDEKTNWSFSIHRIGENDGEILVRSGDWRLIETQIIGNRLVYYIINDENGKGKLNEYNFKTKETTEIVEDDYKSDESGTLLKGRRVFALDGFKDGVIFRVEIADEKEKKRKWENWYYDFDGKNLEKLPIEHEEITDYIGGDKDCVIVGNNGGIDGAGDTDNVGTIYIRKADGSYIAVVIPMGEIDDYIRKTIRISDNIIAVSVRADKFYLIDYKKGIYEEIKGYAKFEKEKIVTENNNKVCIYENFK